MLQEKPIISFQLCKHRTVYHFLNKETHLFEKRQCSDCLAVWNHSNKILSKYPGCDCANCPANFREAAFVPPVVPSNAQVGFVGMMPASNEVQRARPFSGPAGEAFDGSLKHVGIERDEVVVDNATLCMGKRPREGDPPVEAITACRQHVLDSLEGTKIVVPMGNAAVRSVLGRNQDRGIMALAGSTFKHDGRIVLPQIHPSFYLSQSSDAFKDFLDSMELLADLLNGRKMYSNDDVRVKIFEDANECIRWLDNLPDCDVLAVDLETDYPDPVKGMITCVSLAYDEEDAFIIPWSSEYLEYHNSNIPPLLEFEEVYQALKRCLERQSNILMYNAPFDARLLMREDINVYVKDDGLLMHYALDERATSQGLKHVAKVTLGVQDWEVDIKKFLKRKDDPYTEVPPTELFRYAGLDGCITVSLIKELQAKLSRPENERSRLLYEERLMPLNRMFIEISLEGVSADGEAIITALKELPAKMRELEQEMCEMVGDRFFNPGSPQQVAKVLFEKYKLPRIKGNSTDKDVLEALITVDEEDEEINIDLLPDEQRFPIKLREFRQLGKVTNTYMVNFAQGYVKGKVFPDIRLFGTTTGRLSGGKVNPLVFPRESRGGIYVLVKDIVIGDFCEELGFRDVIWATDFSGMELRILAYLADDPWLKEVLSDRENDFHSTMAEAIFGDRFKYADPDERKELRVIAKMFVFGLNYGRGAPSIARQMKCSIAEANKLINNYFAPMPKVLQWRKDMERIAIKEELLEIPVFNRSRRFHLVRRDNMHDIMKQAINTPVQSIANDVNLSVMLHLRENMHPVVKPKFPVHDSIEKSVRVDITSEQVQEVLTTFSTLPNELLGVEDLIFYNDIHIGNSWGQAELEGKCESVEDIMDRIEQCKQEQIEKRIARV